MDLLAPEPEMTEADWNRSIERLSGLGELLEAVHHLGHPSGHHEFDSPVLTSTLVTELVETQPPHYVDSLASAVKNLAAFMASRSAEETVRFGESWHYIRRHVSLLAAELHSRGRHYAGASSETQPHDMVNVTAIDVPKLARLVSSSATQHFLSALATLQSFAAGSSSSSCPLDSVDAAILSHLLRDDDAMQIGLQVGYSRRSVQRRIAQIVRKVGAHNKYHAVSIATAEGWIR